MKFRISNASNMQTFFVLGGVFYALMFFGLVVAQHNDYKYYTTMFMIVWLYGMTYFITVMILRRMKTDVEYDGLKIIYKSRFRKKEIDLMQVRFVRYGFKHGVDKKLKDNVYLEFEYYDTSKKKEILFDAVSQQDMSRIMQGVHFGYPLLLMYDDIVMRFPEKKGFV